MVGFASFFRSERYVCVLIKVARLHMPFPEQRNRNQAMMMEIQTQDMFCGTKGVQNVLINCRTSEGSGILFKLGDISSLGSVPVQDLYRKLFDVDRLVVVLCTKVFQALIATSTDRRICASNGAKC